jgi:hypothetical protein
MRKYHSIYILSIVSLLIFNAILIIKDYRTKHKIDLVSNKINAFDNYYKLMEWREKEAILNNGTRLFDSLTVIDNNKNSIALSNISGASGKSPKLVIRYSALACDICLEYELKLITNHIPEIGIENIILLASSCNTRGTKILTKYSPFDLKIYQVEKIGIPFETENNNLFVFVLDKDFYVKDFFIPEKTLPDLSENYYEAIQNKYWQ